MSTLDTGWVDAEGDVGYINTTSIGDDAVMPQLREIASKLTDWTRGQRARTGASNLFTRDKYATSDNPYDEMLTARQAVRDDDIVSAAADVSTALMLQECRWESPNEDIADVFNQVSAALDLDNYLRVVAREEFTDSHSVTASWWSRQTFTPRTRAPQKDKDGKPVLHEATGKPKRGNARRKEIQLFVPDELITLDARKVVPVGRALFGGDRLAWNATPEESDLWETGVSQGLVVDATMTELFQGKYTPSKEEAAELNELGVSPDFLLELRPDRVWRHTATRSSYRRFADVRLRSTFRLLDLKQQLMEADRVNLVGAANYILLVKKGTDAQPAVQEEVANLKENFRSIAKLPVIVSDHRLEIEIITPKIDLTLQVERYDLLDRRIAARALGAMDGAGDASGESGGQVRTRMIARNLEARRRMLRRTVERNLRDAIWNHPANAAALSEYKDDEKPSLAFTPRNIQVDNDSQMIQAVVSARQARDLSRESYLSFLGFDQDVEAQRREREEELGYDAIFQTAVPFSAAGQDGQPGQPGQKPGEPSAVAGARGGRPAGGGRPAQSAQKSVKPSTASGATSKS